MRRFMRFFYRAECLCALWISLCFSLTSAAYLSWVYRLMDFATPHQVDVYSLVFGYACQAIGLLISFIFFRKTHALADWKAFCICVLFFCIVTLPAITGKSLPGILVFGCLMNALGGILAGFYLCGSAMNVQKSARGKVFGLGYGISTFFIFLVSLFEDHHFLQSQTVLIVDILLAVAAIGAAYLIQDRSWTQEAAPKRPVEQPFSKGTVCLAAAAVLLLSMVKNLGFSFPAADLRAGTNLELSRLFYAVGLIVAGILTDQSRKTGAICTIAAMVLPFVMLALSGESLPAMICWGLDYLFYGFFSVFRAVLFMDIAERNGHWPLAALGLLAGRAGDALGTGFYHLFSFSRLLLIGFIVAAFTITLFLCVRLYPRLYLAGAARERSEREVFESFSIQYDLSAREREVLRLILEEKNVPQIAESLFVAESTVRYHIHHLLQKTGCKTRQELARQYHMERYPCIASNQPFRKDGHMPPQ